jgi:succinate dehydrogenase / fumarate reductase cytochrome b subunit
MLLKLDCWNKRNAGNGMPIKNKKRPINLDLLHIRLPIGGVVSILHRISGVLLVLALPLVFLLLQESMHSPESFVKIVALLRTLSARVLLFLVAILLAHHFIAGVRHLLLDLDVGISRRGSRLGAWIVLIGVLGSAIAAAGCIFP